MRARHSRGAAPAAVAVVALLQLAALATCSSAQPGGAPAVGCLEAATLALRADILAKVAANATNSDNVTSAVRSGLATFASCLNVTSLLNFEVRCSQGQKGHSTDRTLQPHAQALAASGYCVCACRNVAPATGLAGGRALTVPRRAVACSRSAS